MKWSFTPVRRKLLRTLRTGAGAFGERSSFVVSVEHDGMTGWGEATPLPELGGETAVECAARLSSAIAQLSSSPTEVLQKIDRLTTRAPAAQFALEQAVLDLLAQQQGVPLSALLSSGAVRELQVNAVVDSPEEALRCVAEGFRTLKLKVGARVDDVERVRAVMRAVGSGIKVRIDANGAWTEGVATEALAMFSGIELCEQPVMDPAAIERIARRGLCPVAVDEGLAAWLDRGSTGVIAVLKPAIVGGLRRCLAIAQSGIDCFVTCGFEGPIGRAGAAHLAAALPAQRFAHGLAMGRFFDDPPSRLDPENGTIRISDVPGLGS